VGSFGSAGSLHRPTDHELTAANGTTVLARWYRLPASDSRAAVVYLHGGGMMLGSLPIFDGPVSRYLAHAGAPMLSVEYRLAPEHPYPTPLEDAYAGLVWPAATQPNSTSTKTASQSCVHRGRQPPTSSPESTVVAG
jgi:acetyl esterase/lipase